MKLFRSTIQQGQWAEELAYQYLSQQGLKLVSRNYRCLFGEMDLIMRQQRILVFIEVRYRRSQRYGGSLESIDKRKQKRLKTIATHYLQTIKTPEPACRFDVVLIQGTAGDPKVQWIADAF